jgi:hypothetical protein
VSISLKILLMISNRDERGVAIGRPILSLFGRSFPESTASSLDVDGGADSVLVLTFLESDGALVSVLVLTFRDSRQSTLGTAPFSMLSWRGAAISSVERRRCGT